MKCQEVFHDPTTTKNRYKIGDNMLGQDVVRGGHMLEVIDASKLHRLIKWQEKLNK